MANMSYLEIKETLNQGYTNISDDEWISMYESAKKLPDDLQEELWHSSQGDVLNMTGMMLTNDYED